MKSDDKEEDEQLEHLESRISFVVGRYSVTDAPQGGGGTLGISGWGCAAGTLEPLTYTRASSIPSLDKIFNQLISFLKSDTLF